MRQMLKKGIGGFLLMLMTVAVIAKVAQAGSLEPSAAPNPTMKTLDQIPPTWDQVLSADVRFQSVMGGAAVLDKETGLVWEQAPDVSTQTWFEAKGYCLLKSVGGRRGWRIPTFEEISSLLDPATQSSPALPSGNPFSNVQSSSKYWSATTDAADTSIAYFMIFTNNPRNLIGGTKSDSIGLAWCVRGGQGVDAQ